jgi:hypothetical protein
MRIWSLHPKYLDTKGLVALWRESLLAQKVLKGKTTGYIHHPQLQRFRQTKDPISSISQYLIPIYVESQRRNYHFDHSKIDKHKSVDRMTVTKGQLLYEWKHLQFKLSQRQVSQYNTLKSIDIPETHPLFKLIEGDIEEWEIIKEHAFGKKE